MVLPQCNLNGMPFENANKFINMSPQSQKGAIVFQ